MYPFNFEFSEEPVKLNSSEDSESEIEKNKSINLRALAETSSTSIESIER